MPSLTYDEIKQFSKIDTSVFVETGTYMGDTTHIAKSHFQHVYTIELSEQFANMAKRRFASDANVTVIQGDSSTAIKSVCERVEQPAFFWLDGHWSGGSTAKGAKDCPLYEELQSIMTYCKESCVIAIDDVRLFGTHTWTNRIVTFVV